MEIMLFPFQYDNMDMGTEERRNFEIECPTEKTEQIKGVGKVMRYSAYENKIHLGGVGNFRKNSAYENADYLRNKGPKRARENADF